MGAKAREPHISHALRAPAPAALTAKAPASAPAGAEGARLGIAADPTHLLTDLNLGDIQRLIAAAESAATTALDPHAAPAPAPAATVAASAAAAAGRSSPGRSPWAWLWAVWEAAAAVYVALTEPRRRAGQSRPR